MGEVAGLASKLSTGKDVFYLGSNPDISVDRPYVKFRRNSSHPGEENWEFHRQKSAIRNKDGCVLNDVC
jgi:hypothetical protein